MVVSKKEKTEKKQESLIESLEKERGSKVIIYCNGDKIPMEQFGTQIAVDVLPLFKVALENIGTTEKITLVLNTNGGHLDTPWPLVNLIREYCKSFEVLVLDKALSAGTLITLGADKIIMMPYSQLGPIDPAANIMDGNSNQVKRLEIEDIIGYIDFVKEKIGIAEQAALAEVMKELTKEISPTTLGSANRTHSLIRKLARNLLYLHKNKLPEKQVCEIVENLTQKLYSHRHLINRKEAKELVGFGNIIEYAKAKTKQNADKIFLQYADIFEIKKVFNPQEILGGEQEKEFSLVRSVVHSNKVNFDFTSTYKINKLIDASGQQQIMMNAIRDEWIQSK